jgi:hypothetical protein
VNSSPSTAAGTSSPVLRLAGTLTTLTVLAAFLGVGGSIASAQTSYDFDTPIEFFSAGTETFGGVEVGVSGTGLAGFPSGGLEYFLHGNGVAGAASGREVDLAFSPGISALNVRIGFNQDSPATEWEQYLLTGRDAGGQVVFEARIRNVSGDFDFLPGQTVTNARTDSPHGDVTFDVSTQVTGIIRTLEVRWTDTNVDGAQAIILVSIDSRDASPAPAPAPRSTLTLDCTPPAATAGMEVVCRVTGGDPDVDILWNASGPAGPFAGRGVALDGSGAGTFTFIVPRGIGDGGIIVELVGWGVTDTVATSDTGGVSPLPVRIDAGGGPAAPGLVLFAGLLALTAARFAVR